MPANRYYSLFEIPAYVQYSPFSLLSLEIGGTGYIVGYDQYSVTTPPGFTLTTQPTSTWTGTMSAYGNVSLTLRHFTFQAAVTHYWYFQSPSAQATYMTFGVEARY